MTDKKQSTPKEETPTNLVVFTLDEVQDIKRCLFWGFLLVYGAIMHASLMEAKWWEITFFVIVIMALAYNASPMTE